jgi:hypothetical protein
LSVGSSQEDACEELRNEFLGELQRMQSCLHRLIDHFTAISGYAQLVQFKPECSVTDLDKIIHTVEKSMVVVRACLASLKDFERRYS